jgi:NAD(P) transhydrogenase
VGDWDLIVIGSGPAGQKAAIQAAKLGRKVALVERRHMVGGVCTNTGTIPSKTLREAVLYLTGWHQRGFYGASYRVKDEIAIGDLFQRTHHVIASEIDVIRDQLTRNHVQIVSGEGRFIDPHTIAVRKSHDNERTLTGDAISPSAPGRRGPATWRSTSAP